MFLDANFTLLLDCHQWQAANNAEVYILACTGQSQLGRALKNIKIPGSEAVVESLAQANIICTGPHSPHRQQACTVTIPEYTNMGTWSNQLTTSKFNSSAPH